MIILPFSELYHELKRAWNNLRYLDELQNSLEELIKWSIYWFKLGKVKESEKDRKERIKKQWEEL